MEFYSIRHSILAMDLFFVPSPVPEIAPAAGNIAAIVLQR
jgi:hypothetical protein